MVELLVVMVILPIVIGAIASAIIISMDSNSTVSNRLAGSVNAQLTSAYFVRDVQGAKEITTDQALVSQSVYSQFNPQVCAPAARTGFTLVLGLYRSPVSGPSGAIVDQGLSVAYWVAPSATGVSQLMRYSCTVAAPNWTATSPIAVVASDDVATAKATIAPPQFSTAATTAWTTTAAITALAGPPRTLPSGTFQMDVASTAGFAFAAAGSPITVVTTTGPQTVTCTGIGTDTTTNPPTPDFTGCSGGVPNSIILTNTTITQSAVSGVQIAVAQQKSGYSYSLVATPRVGVSGIGPGLLPCLSKCSGPALLTLGTNGGVTLQDTAASLTVLNGGGIVVDGGSISCGGSNPGPNAAGGIAATSSVANGCSTPASTTPYVPDPLQNAVPACFPAQPAPSGNTSTKLNPGRYTSSFPGSGNHTVEPGLYELDGGFSIGNNQTLTLDPNAPAGAGVLLYIPNAGTGGCGTVTTAPSVSMAAGASVNLPPLSVYQSECYFGGGGPNCGTATTSSGGSAALGGVWLWQNLLNTNPATLGGNSTGSSAGLGYFPGAAVTLYGTPGAFTGSLIAASLTLAGNSAIVVTNT
jgi:hypothetical protein